jgi:magnesium-transporting ATPase (P-type)
VLLDVWITAYQWICFPVYGIARVPRNRAVSPVYSPNKSDPVEQLPLGFPAVGLADDYVDRELVDRLRRWDIRFMGRFMLVFGLVSSAFDLITFAVLRGVFGAPPDLFRTAWFVESLLSELVITRVVRTRRPVLRSRLGPVLLWSTIVLIAIAAAIPFVPFASVVGCGRSQPL